MQWNERGSLWNHRGMSTREWEEPAFTGRSCSRHGRRLAAALNLRGGGSEACRLISAFAVIQTSDIILLHEPVSLNEPPSTSHLCNSRWSVLVAMEMGGFIHWSRKKATEDLLFRTCTFLLNVTWMFIFIGCVSGLIFLCFNKSFWTEIIEHQSPKKITNDFFKAANPFKTVTCKYFGQKNSKKKSEVNEMYLLSYFHRVPILHLIFIFEFYWEFYETL